MGVTGYLPPVIATLAMEGRQFFATAGAAKAEMKGMESTAGRLGAVGKAALLGLTLAAAGIAAESVHLASNFDAAMELVHTQAGASQAEVEKLKGSVLGLASTGQTPIELAKGLYHIESAGFRGATALSMLTAAAKGATIGQADLESVTQAMIGVMASGIPGVHGAADAMAYLNTITGIGDMRMSKLAAAVSTGILPSFRSAGLTMADFGAALATLTDNAVPADEAATRLRMTVALMAAPSHQAVKALHTIGITGVELANDMRKPDGLLVAVMDLKTHLEKAGLSASQQNQVIEKAFGGGRTSGAILTLIEESGRLTQKYKDLGTQGQRSASYAEAWAKTQKQFATQVHQLVAELEVLGIKIGNWLIPRLQSLAVHTMAVIGWFERHKTVAEILAVAIGSVLVVAVAAYTVAMVQAAVATVAATWPVLLIIAAAAALGVAIFELATHWKQVWGAIVRFTMHDVVAPILIGFKAVADGVLAAVEWMLRGLGHLPGRFGAPFRAAAEAVHRSRVGFDADMSGMIASARRAGDNIGHSYDHVAKAIVVVRAQANGLVHDLAKLNGTSATVRIITQYSSLGDPNQRAVPGKAVGHAAGVASAAAGWAMVGERGPEWMYFRGGETVLPHGTPPPPPTGGTKVTVVHNHYYNIAGTVVAERDLLDLVRSGSQRYTRNNSSSGFGGVRQ